MTDIETRQRITENQAADLCFRIKQRLDAATAATKAGDHEHELSLPEAEAIHAAAGQMLAFMQGAESECPELMLSDLWNECTLSLGRVADFLSKLIADAKKD